jgi:RimJ/RimL family protein N-acetyltransferase
MKINDPSNEVLLELSLAKKEDMMITFEWASNPYLRKYSPNNNSIPFQTHQNWFLKKLQDPACRFYIVKVDGKPAGTCRLDFVNSNAIAEISYLLDPEYHGKGLGLKTIEELVKKAKLELSSGLPKIKLIAKVHKKNVASLLIFEKTGFNLTLHVNNDNPQEINIHEEEYIEFNRVIQL